MNKYQLIFDIQSDWHIGNGKEGGAYADALVLKDNDNLPYLPGKSIKGLLRHAFSIASVNNWFSDNSKDLLNTIFGNENREGAKSQGALQLSSARLSSNEQDFFKENKTASKHLYRVLQYTAIEHKSGVAKESSLRSIEVAVPMLLTAELNLNANHPALKDNLELKQQFFTALDQVVPLITELGAKRHRGLGKVFVSVRKNKKDKKSSARGGKH